MVDWVLNPLRGRRRRRLRNARDTQQVPRRRGRDRPLGWGAGRRRDGNSGPGRAAGRIASGWVETLREDVVLADERLLGHRSGCGPAGACVCATGTGLGRAALEAQVLACRCLANLMEALPGVAHTVVYHGAIPVLCSKLIEISYIDLAEQTLSVSVFLFRVEVIAYRP